ncbi:ras association domain-containing protein 10 [Ahaetulla prasina]|uniref:ras association domain-containing protein 10 n=1 Tax=Ahaetulla prasina TaxID=499056 RepID=UPI00264735DC|nr:ras association domain-containing protein 10 [Ahaetulla prasina]
MEPAEKKISVWICQEEKLISGLTKRTTCSDVVRVLLEESKQRRRRRQQQQQASLQECGGGMLSGLPQSYCIVEKWRGFERILPNKTKILRLWAAWGDEQENVRFVLVRSEASLPNTGPRSAEARVVPSRDSPGCRGLGVTARASLALSQERQRRVVRKAFRKLAKINKRKGQPQLEEPPAKEAPAGERMETLVHLVLSQDHTIRQQIKRLRDLDREIDRYEARIHFDRMKRHGVNYVQDTYLVGEEPEPPAGEQELKSPAGAAPTTAAGELEEPSSGSEDLEEYAWKCEQVARVQEQWRRQEELIEHLAGEIQEELNERWMRRRREELAAAKGSSASLSETDCNTTELSGGGGGGGGELHVEQERVKTQLSTSLYIGLRLNTDLDAVKSDLEFTQRAWADKERELQRLLDSLESLHVEGEEEEEEGEETAVADEDERRDLPFNPGDELPASIPITSGDWGEEAARSLSKDREDREDEDSDTGLSSMHSQDSDSVPVCESLV